MIALDTNILARWLLGDEPKASDTAARILAAPCSVSFSVITELGRVLEKSVKVPRPVVADMLEQLFTLDMLTLPDADGLGWAVGQFRKGADWADMVHLLAAKNRADVFVTFDRRLAKQAGHETPIPVKTL